MRRIATWVRGDRLVRGVSRKVVGASLVLLTFVHPTLAQGQRADSRPDEPRVVPPAGVPRGQHLRWGLIDALGYGGAGLGVGTALVFADGECTLLSSHGSCDSLVLIPVGFIAGLIVGGRLGHSASVALREGRPIGAVHRTAVLAGVVLAGASVGALASVPLIGGEGAGTLLGNDEQTFALMTATGVAIGAVVARRYGEALSAQDVAFAPMHTSDGRIGVRFGVRF